MSGAIALAAASQGNRVAWVAPTYKQSRPLWRWAEKAAGGVGTIHKSERTISFGSGFVGIYSGDNADSMRGESFNLVVLDEASRISEEAWTDVIQPTLADFAGDAILISTPRGRNWFYREWQRGIGGHKGYAAFSAPTSDNPHPNIKRAAEMAKLAVSERTYRQEWLAEFVDDGGGVFQGVRACATLEPLEKPEDNHTYVAGLDWALSYDYTVLTIMDATTRKMVAYRRFNGVGYSVQRDRIKAAYEQFKLSAIVAEENAMGKPNNEALRDAGLVVRDFNTNAVSKSTVIENLAGAFERKQIQIINDPLVIGELEAYEMERTPSGGMKYNAPSGMHDDCVMSLALAWEACGHTITGELMY